MAEKNKPVAQPSAVEKQLQELKDKYPGMIDKAGEELNPRSPTQ